MTNLNVNAGQPLFSSTRVFNKSSYQNFFIIAVLFFCSQTCFGQLSENEFIKTKVSFNANITTAMLPQLQLQNKTSFATYLRSILAGQNGMAGELGQITSMLSAGGTGLFDRIDQGENAAIVVVYRNMQQFANVTTGETKFTIDYDSRNSLVYHKKRIYDNVAHAYPYVWSDYFLGTKEIYIIYIDFDDDFHKLEETEEKELSNSVIAINYKTSFSKQSFLDLKKVIAGALSNSGAAPTPTIKITIEKVNSRAIKDPCDIVITNKGFKDNLTMVIHDKNYSSFQVGLINSQFRVNNFSLANGNLTVKPDDTQKEEWKSNIFASFEFHPFGYYSAWGRDIDNFVPFWNDVFRDKKLDKIGFARWLKHITLSRIGIYGGLRISKDPLQSLHAGFNYAITKELYLNLGWTWTNELVPQVTEVGNISSLDDALKYGKRKYGDPRFGWGLSFSPSAVIDMLGLTGQGKEKK